MEGSPAAPLIESRYLLTAGFRTEVGSLAVKGGGSVKINGEREL